MKDFVKVMKALSDPNRVKIVKMLQYKKLCVCEIQVLLQVAQPSVSKHLKVLDNAGIVESFKDGLWVNYSLADGSISPYVSSVIGNLRHWLNADPQIRDMVSKLPETRREDLCKK
ncbi:metalloregulator ArsR/SmtB family transcription factor [Thermodesulfobacteriota bacterium]